MALERCFLCSEAPGPPGRKGKAGSLHPLDTGEGALRGAHPGDWPCGPVRLLLLGAGKPGPAPSAALLQATVLPSLPRLPKNIGKLACHRDKKDSKPSVYELQSPDFLTRVTSTIIPLLLFLPPLFFPSSSVKWFQNINFIWSLCLPGALSKGLTLVSVRPDF